MNLVLLNVLILITTHFKYASTDPIGTGGPTVISEGKDALLTCVIMGPYSNDTVIWKKGSTIISAGINRVTVDKRISILHDETPKGKTSTGGDVWVLLIRDARPSDTAIYVCEVNSDPTLQSFHPLRVKSLNQTVKSVVTDQRLTTTISPIEEPTTPLITHDFTDCCQSLNVSTNCMGYCTIHNILDGTTGTEPEMCEKDFPNIVKCMADGRNHLPCCEKKKIPDLCQDMCQGEYTPYTDYVRSRVSCVAHTLPALQCILQGIQILPSEPENVYVEPINEKSLQVSWTAPEKFPETITSYSINVTRLHSFDQDELTNMTSEISVTVSSDLESAVINDLKPFTMYAITVTANNKHGSSLPSVRIRALTLDSGVGTQTSVAVVPVLPNIRQCCVKQGMTHHTCLDRMCDPKKADFTEIPDLMVCAPWANITFSCLANKIDHSPCCMARGIPNECLSFCVGNITTITFNLFRCLQYMSDYSSCLLQGYGVLAGPPSKVKAPLIAPHFAILEWKQPKVLPDTVTSYHVYIRKLLTGEEYTTLERQHPPIILENLDAGTYYESYVVAVNAHGKGLPSPRLVFHTKYETEVEPELPVYNITKCCKAAGLLPQCMPLCTYNLKMSDLHTLGETCQQQMGALSKCAAGGRDHTSCCNRRGVPPKCMSYCRGIIPQPLVDCTSFGGNIIQCFEEGTGNIPGPVEDLHVTTITKNSISLEWVPYQPDTNVTDDLKNIDYVVQYGKVNNMTMYETIVKLENEINTTETEIELNNLEENALYRILVVARNEHGMSLPSSMLLINTSSHVNYTTTIYAAPSPPHSLTISDHSATWVTIAWQPPEFSHPHEILSYQIFHKSTSADKFSIIETRFLWARLNNLEPNSQHVVYVIANGTKGLSLASETLVAWTDPALPAFVDPPTIHPADIIAEGGTMTILCLALGNPAPTISLYVGGHLVRQDTSRHMVTTMQNVSTDMEHVSCYADNGYGIPMQASKRVHISFKPQIQASGITLALLGERVDLRCTVKAKPMPKVIFWRDHEGRVPVIVGKNYEMTMEASSADTSTSVMTLTILKLTNEYVGDYYCHAENPLGSATTAVSVRIRQTAPVHNITECCVAQNVSSNCIDACSFYVDIEAVKDRAECISEFDKLMKCAGDGSDHRSCCANNDVPRHCLNWCRGEPVGVKGSCVLSYTKTIIDCFQSNRERLPSPPTNLAVQVISDDEANISWDVPKKNPHMVEGYRIYWHEADPVTDGLLLNKINGIGTHRVDTKDLFIKISDLRPNTVYKLVALAGNQFGSSVLTDPIRFTIGDHHITSASNSSSAAGTVLGILAGILTIALAIAGIFFYQRRKFQKSANGVAFENPSYLREVNMEHVQISAVSNGDTTTATNNGGSDWRQERLQTPNGDHLNHSVSSMATEVNPSLYEELKLGHEGAGFKRLVS